MSIPLGIASHYSNTIYQVSQQPYGPGGIINSIFQMKKLRYTLIKLLALCYKGSRASELEIDLFQYDPLI